MPEQNLEHWMKEVQSEQPFLDEETLISVIEQRVLQLITDQPDLLFSYLYRLDVDENKIQSALSQGDQVARALATLIVQRQKIRVATKSQYRNGPDQPEESSFNPIDY